MTEPPTKETPKSTEPRSPKRENVWLNIGLNVLIPSLIMSKATDLQKYFFKLDDDVLPKELPISPAWVLVFALAFPICYGIYDFATRKKYNFFSILGFVSILISGGVGLLELDKDWIAVKEAAIPALFAVAVWGSLKTPFPLVRTFLYSPEIFDVPKVEAALAERNNRANFETLIKQCTYYLVASFALSAVLNYALAKYFVRSETGTPEFLEELGKMTFWSWPVITIPSMAVMMLALLKLVKGIYTNTGYELEDVLLAAQDDKRKKEEEADKAETDTAETGEKVNEKKADKNEIDANATESPNVESDPTDVS